jgi:hypothetical protein
MTGPAIIIIPLNGAIIAYVISTWLFDFRPGSGKEWGFIAFGAFVGLWFLATQPEEKPEE